jgi:hypothetical protein
MKAKKLLMALIAVVVLIGSTGLTFQQAQAAACARYHIVSWGESLSWIGRYYGIPWTTLAQINNIKNPSLIYTGQKICLVLAGGNPPTPGASWSYQVVDVQKDSAVSIRTHNFPDNVLFDVKIGMQSGGAMQWIDVGDLDSDRGGTFKATFNIPAAYAGKTRLAIRLIQDKKLTTVDRWFNNVSGGTGGAGGGWYWYYGGIPTIWITSVVRNTSVTIRTHNFPAGLNFDVYMGPMGTRGVGGYHVGSFSSGSGGELVKTFSIPPQLVNHYQISIRTQNTWTGYYSYNWFYNNNAP